jgi:PAS domain S-box-containing protein
MAPMAHEFRLVADSLHGDAAEARFRELLDGLPETVFEIDLGGRFLYVNRRGLEIFGYTRDDLERGLTAIDMFVPEEHERARLNIARRLRGETPDDREYRARRKDGGVFPALVHTNIVYKDGRPSGLRGYLVDISDRVQAEAALLRRVSLEQLFMRISTRLVAELAPRELDVRIEEALCQIGRAMGADRSYVFLFRNGGELMDNSHEWVAEGIAAERASLQALSTGSAFPWFMRELRAQGVVQVTSVAELPEAAARERAEFEREGIRSLVCVAMVHEGTLGGFLGLDAVRAAREWSSDEISFLRVVAEALMGALARRRSEEALQESERKYKALVETTATGFVILDEEGRVLDANSEYVRVSGHRSLEEIRGRCVVEWTARHDRERNAQAVAACSRDGQAKDLQIDYCHADGTLVPVLINASVTEVDGVRRIVALLRDISDRKRLEEALLRSEKLRSVGVLAGGIAHDFNNILTSILGNVSLMQVLLGGDDYAREHLDEIERASQRARELTRQLLTFSRGGEPIRRPFHLDPVIRESVTLALRGRASACQLSIPAGLWAVHGDEGQISQVIRNLVINASQAMGDGGTIEVSVVNQTVREGEVHTLSAGDYLVLAVGDHGQGIAEDDRSRIFDPYFTTKRDGRGLGLAVCHSVVVGHGGAITVDSQVGEGSVFRVYLPVAKAGVPVAAARETALMSGHGRVLIMDDEESVRRIAGKIVRALGYEVALASDGRDAIEKWQQAREKGCPFDVAIMDLTVSGGMGGLEAVGEIIALDPSAKAIVSSGYSQNPVMANYRDYGFCDVLAKPYSVVDVSRALFAVLSAKPPHSH